MIFTIVPALMLMAGLFLMLWAEVGFIQDKRLASSAPAEVLAGIPDTKPERFRGQHAVGWAMVVISLVLIVSAVVLGARDGIQHHFGFWQFFTRFVIMFLALKAFDIGFFDWFLLCRKGLNFFTHYYPDMEGVLGPHMFGFNKKSHLIQIIILIGLSAVLAWICTLF